MDDRDPGASMERERVLRAAVLAGDETAWRLLYDEHFDPLHAFLHCRTGRLAQRTEEAAEECWLVAVRRIRSFDPDRGSFEAWLRGIAENVLRNLRRRWARDEAMRDGAMRVEAVAIDAASAAARASTDADLAEGVALALTEIPARYGAVLRAKYQEGLSTAEIARRGGETPKAVESLLARAREAFRAAYLRLTERESA